MLRIIKTGRIPEWWLTGYAPDVSKAYDVFRAFLGGLSLSLTDVAKDIGVDQSTVSRWAIGRSQPTPEQMNALIAAVQARLKTLTVAADRIAEAIQALQEVGDAFEAFVEAKSGEVSEEEFRRAAQLLRETLEKSDIGANRRERPARPARKRRTEKRNGRNA